MAAGAKRALLQAVILSNRGTPEGAKVSLKIAAPNQGKSQHRIKVCHPEERSDEGSAVAVRDFRISSNPPIHRIEKATSRRSMHASKRPYDSHPVHRSAGVHHR